MILSPLLLFLIYFILLTLLIMTFVILKLLVVIFNVNPIWTGLFANLKRLGEGGEWSPFNFAISSQMMLKLNKDIIWIEIFTN